MFVNETSQCSSLASNHDLKMTVNELRTIRAITRIIGSGWPAAKLDSRVTSTFLPVKSPS
jgi:hypothetical protein